MSKYLFCSTDLEGFREDCLDDSLNYQNSAFMDIKPDIYGLKDWFEFKPDFSKYKMIYLHLNPRVMNPEWYAFPRLIRSMCPKANIMVSHEYWEKYCSEPMPYTIKNAMTYASYILVNSKAAYNVLIQNVGSKPIIYAHLCQPTRDEVGWLDPLPWKDRKGVVLIEHSVETNLVKPLEIIRDAGLKAILITSNPSHNKRWWESYVDAYNLDADYYARLSFSDYIDVIRHAKAGIDLGYAGICRFSYECAKVHVPVLGHSKLEYCNIIYPELTINKSVDAVSLLKKVHNVESFSIALNRYSDILLREYWSKEACNNRLMKLLRELGVD